MNKGPAPTFGERLRSALTWHIVVFALLLALAVVMCARLGMDWAATNTHAADERVIKQVQLAQLNLQMRPLRGLDKNVDKARDQINGFFDQRIPADYSAIESSMTNLEVKTGVRLTRVQYSQGKPGTDLTQIAMDAAISGDYPSIMRFVNGIERARTFYIIQEMGLTGEQNGLVNLHLRVLTWLRPSQAAASGLPMTPPAEDQAPAGSSTNGTEEQ